MDSATLGIILLVIGVWFFLLRTRGARLDATNEFDALIAGGRPVVVEFFSNT